MEAPNAQDKVLVVAVEDLYQNRPCDEKSEDLINATLPNNRELMFSEKGESSITALTVQIPVDRNDHPVIRLMLKKHKPIWSGPLGEINLLRIY